MKSDELMHHGIVNMHWRIRRYQNRDGSLTPEGRIRYAAMKRKKRIKAKARELKAIQKAQKVEQKKAQKALNEAAAKEKLMRSGSAKKVLKGQSKLSNDELRQAIDRIKSLKEIEIKKSNAAPKSKESKLKKINETHQAVNKLLANTSLSFDNYKKLIPKLNSIFGTGTFKMPRHYEDPLVFDSQSNTWVPDPNPNRYRNTW